jgi:segregation and condensation protein B
MSDETVEIADDEIEDGEEPLQTLSREETRETLYALLFVSDRPMNAGRLAEALGDIDDEVVENLLGELRAEINQQAKLPYSLELIGGGYQLVSKPQHGPYIRKLLQIKRSKRLSRAVLETLAIIAYKQPVTRAEVEAIRGVSVSYAFDQLEQRRLIKVSGIAELPGRPRLYRTTDDFLMQFGLNSLKELPTLDELRDMS